jgi:hypothetical protein
MNGALLPLAALGSLAVASELRGRPARPGAAGSASRTQRLGFVLVVTAAATAAVLWPKRAQAAVAFPRADTVSPPLAPPASASASEAPPEAAPLPEPAPVRAGRADDPFYRALLRGIGGSPTPATLQFLYAWRQAEGGTARYNPFNTTQRMPGSSAYNTVGVQHYPDPQTGVNATVKTILNGRYANLVAALRAGTSSRAMVQALAASPWGTGDLARRVLAGYEAGATVKAPAIATASGATAIASLDAFAPGLV